MANVYVFGASTYRAGAFEGLSDSKTLLEAGHFAGCVYLSGRGVESMLRAVIWPCDHQIQTGAKSLDAGHDLFLLLREVGKLGVLQRNDRDDRFQADVQFVARLWFNNMRFASSKVEQFWKSKGHLKKDRMLKSVAGEFHEACQRVVKRCEILMQKR